MSRVLKETQICVSCKKNLSYSQFYKSSSELFSLTGIVPICKECMFKQSVDEKGKIDLVKFKEVLRKVDKPFLLKIWKSAINETDKFNGEGDYERRVFGRYWKNIQTLRQLCHLTNKDSDEFENKSLNLLEDKKNIEFYEDEDFEITPEVIELFGDGYQKIEYKKMYEKYNKLKTSYYLQTSLHQESLATYVRFKVKEEIATAKGDVVEAKKWYDAAIDAADRGKLTPKQLTQADLQKGVNSFSELSLAVEQATDIISILPKFKYQPNDAPDFIIWCYINYGRKLKGLPLVEYKDIYEFYDKRKKEYLSQYGDRYGIFNDDTTKQNRDNIEKFITLPDDYNTENDGEEE